MLYRLRRKSDGECWVTPKPSYHSDHFTKTGMYLEWNQLKAGIRWLEKNKLNLRDYEIEPCVLQPTYTREAEDFPNLRER